MIKGKKEKKKFLCLSAFYCFGPMTWATAEDLRETVMRRWAIYSAGSDFLGHHGWLSPLSKTTFLVRWFSFTVTYLASGHLTLAFFL